MKVKYKGKEYNIPDRYLANLKGKERTAQIKSIVEKTERPKVKGFKSKPSSWTEKFKKKYGDVTKIDDIAKATGIPKKALNEVLKKGKGAFYSSGSRPNQSAASWSRARMYAFIMGGKAVRKVDKGIIEKYNIKNLFISATY